MPLATLDPAVALIVVDLQNGTVSAPTAHPADAVVANAVELVDAFRARSLPVVIATVDGTPAGRTGYGAGARAFPAEWTALVPQLERRPDDLAVTRATWSVFAGTGLDAQLKQRGVTQVVIVGLATSFGVESTARDAYDAGYNVVIAVDAVTDRSIESHDNSVARVFPALGEVAGTAEVVAAFA